MNETSKSSSKQRIIEQKNKVTNKNKKGKFQVYDIFKCCYNFYSSLKYRKENNIYNCSIMTQFIIFLVPIAHGIAAILTVLHLYLFDQTFKFDYYTLMKEDYLRYLITDVDDAHFELNFIETKSQFEDLGNLMFFKVYFDELISIGLLDEEKIFPNVSNVTGNFLSYIDTLYSHLRSNTNFTISSNLSQKYIDGRNDSLSELAKVYYNFYPLISFEAFSINTFINQTFLIAYQMNDDNNNISGTPMYFNFPISNGDSLENSNFFPYNNFIAPKISLGKSEHTNLLNDSFYYENWFEKQDYDFREFSKYYEMTLNFLHLNVNHEGRLNKTSVVTIQNFYKNNKGKRFIINIIFYINQKKLIIDSFDHSVFIITNYSHLFTKEKYSDNLTYVISQSDITEISLSHLIDQYFHYGLTAKNYNFYSKGIFYDNIDLNYLSEPTNNFSTIKGFNFDLKYFSSFYLYAKLFQKSTFEKKYSQEKNINIYIFNDKWQIKNVCNKFNFNSYKNYLKENDINCWNTKNLLYYSMDKVNNSHNNNLPYCICLPLYCIKNNNKDFDPMNIEFVEEITLPEKCQNNLKYYENQILEKNLEKKKYT